jgi:hypothetical protein
MISETINNALGMFLLTSQSGKLPPEESERERERGEGRRRREM